MKKIRVTKAARSEEMNKIQIIDKIYEDTIRDIVKNNKWNEFLDFSVTAPFIFH